MKERKGGGFQPETEPQRQLPDKPHSSWEMICSAGLFLKKRRAHRGRGATGKVSGPVCAQPKEFNQRGLFTPRQLTPTHNHARTLSGHQSWLVIFHMKNAHCKGIRALWLQSDPGTNLHFSLLSTNKRPPSPSSFSFCDSQNLSLVKENTSRLLLFEA